MHVIATAGHVDHGKSTLVRALTGMEPDRWEEERRRGMTIDLGFAWMTLPSGTRLAFVDVPGHERFVSNMLAGAGPAPAVMFVVAADEGWMPQSAEHLAAIDALGVRNGMLVITRADLADPAPALQQAVSELAATSLGRGTGAARAGAGTAGAPEGLEAVTVSARTGQGIPDLVAALDRLAARLPDPDPHAPVRLWLDRVFRIKGSGTVVTGTLQAGTVRAGDELTVTPAKHQVRVRSVQSLGAPVPKVSGVARVALNLRNAGAADLGRGMALIHPGRWTLTRLIDVRMSPPAAPAAAGQRRGASAPAGSGLRLPPRVTLHIGAARTVARVRMLGSLIARLSLDQPLPLHVGDRVLLRDPGAGADRDAGRPVFGATVLDVAPPKLRGTGAAAAAESELMAWPEPPTASDLLRRHRLLRVAAAAAMGLRGLPAPVTGDWLADPGHWRRLGEQLVAAVSAHAERDPLAAGLPLGAARAELGLPDRQLVEALARGARTGHAGLPIEVMGGYLRLARRAGRSESSAAGEGDAPTSPAASRAGLPPRVADAVQAVLDSLAEQPFRAPDTERLAQLGLDPRAAAAAERAGLLRRLPGNVIVAADATDRAARILAGIQQPFTAAEARQALNTSRRVVIPLLELLDREGITRRLPDDRRMLRSSARRPT